MAGKRSIRADQTPPRKTKIEKQMVDIRGFPLSTEQGAPLITEKDSYLSSEYKANYARSVVVDSDSYREEGNSLGNTFSKGSPAALPIVEQFREQSEVSRSLLGIDRQTSQQGLFSNVSTYGLDPKDWRVDGSSTEVPDRWWWTRRPSSTGNYYFYASEESSKNSAIALTSNPIPFQEPPVPKLQDQLLGKDLSYVPWGEYLNSLVAMYLLKYMVSSFTREQWNLFNLIPTLKKYPPILNSDGTYSFNELYWDKLWLDIQQSRFGPITNYPIIPKGKAYNFKETSLVNWRSNSSLWGSNSVFIAQANQNLPVTLNTSWDDFFFSTTRVYFPEGLSENKGHFRLKTNPTEAIWKKYHGIRWSELRQDLKGWEFTIHPTESTVTQLEKELKLPYFVLDNPIVPDRVNNLFSNLWPSESFGEQINLPASGNRIGGVQGEYAEITLKSVRSFRYQPGRISGFTYGVKVSEIGAGPGTIIEFGIENATDSYMFRLTNGALFSIIRRSTIPLEETELIENSNYPGNTKTTLVNGITQYETIIEQKDMNGDPLSGAGDSGYLLNPDTVTMYKIEFGWYGAIGAKFYAYIPTGSGECRWVTMHTLVIENQLGRPCLADPFFYFKYRLKVQDSSAIRVNQFIYKFGASYYIDGYDEGTLYSLNAQSGVRYLPSPGFSESKTRLNAVDWVTVAGIKPRRYVTNRFGNILYNKKEIFPEKLFVYSQQDCELKIIRQKGCPEWAYSNQEGYRWTELPANRRLKGKFTISPFFELDFSELGISSNDASTHTAIASYVNPSSGGFRNPSTESNWSVIGTQNVRVVGDDLFGVHVSPTKYFNPSLNTVSVKLNRETSDFALPLLTSRRPTLTPTAVYLPFTYPEIEQYEDGYDIEFDYFRRDQVLLSSINILSDEFYILWTSGDLGSVLPNHASSARFGIVWPETSNTSSPLYSTGFSADWGVQSSPEYDSNTFYEGLPYDFVSSYPQNTLYYETSIRPSTNTYNLESGEWNDYYYKTRISDRLEHVPGIEGGTCRALYCKAGRELREGVSIVSEFNPVTSLTEYYISDTKTPWPNLSPDTYVVNLIQGSTIRNVTTTGGIVKTLDSSVQYLLPIGSSLPSGISSGSLDVSYNIIYMATVDKELNPQFTLVSKIAPGNIPFIRAFIQGRQGLNLGGVWIGQKTPNGLKVEPFTPHRCTVSISDTGVDSHGQWSSPQQDGGPVKTIQTYTQPDLLGSSTAPTNNPFIASLDTNKSIHTSPKKCGSFLGAGGVNSAGILTPSEYPIRWLSSGIGSPLASYYIPSNTPVEIDLADIFNISGESIVNEDDGNLATFFIARSLNNHTETSNEIYTSLNYTEQ